VRQCKKSGDSIKSQRNSNPHIFNAWGEKRRGPRYKDQDLGGYSRERTFRPTWRGADKKGSR